MGSILHCPQKNPADLEWLDYRSPPQDIWEEHWSALTPRALSQLEFEVTHIEQSAEFAQEQEELVPVETREGGTS
jgi:hypothetical protein